MFCRFDQFCTHFSKFSLEDFTNFWKNWADDTVFSSYELATSLKSGVISDFINKICPTIDDENIQEPNMNVTINENLLAFKLVLNKNTPHLPEYYHALQRVGVKGGKDFEDLFYISQANSSRLRQTSEYNKILEKSLGFQVGENFSKERPIYNPATWRRDLEMFLHEPEFASVRNNINILNTNIESWRLNN